MNYRIAICDDEISICSELENVILEFAKNNDYRFDVEVWHTAESCCADLLKFNPDILFLDIELPGDNGVTVGKYIRDMINDNGMTIIFISHKSNYAMELFQVHPYDFLIKPINKDRIHGLLEQLMSIYKNNSQEFVFTYKNETIHLLTGDIMYLQSMDKHIVIVTKTQKYQYVGKLDETKMRLPSKNFLSIGKSYVINLNYLKIYKTDMVTMSDGTSLNISKSHRSAFRQAYMDYNMWGGVRNA